MDDDYLLPILKPNKIFNDYLTKDSFKNWGKIGQGAFGKVFKAEYNNHYYAIKVLAKNKLSNNNKMKNQIKNEINIMLKLNHENIINLYYYFEDCNYIYLIMDLAEEGHLYDELKKEKTFSEDKCLYYLKQLWESLNYLHSQNPKIIHRDIKPENLLLKNDILKLADFGWSNFNNDLRNTYCGTPEYLSPEMIQGIFHNEKLDIWCSGILGYELFYGISPFFPSSFPPESNTRQKRKIIENNILNANIKYSGNKISNNFKNLLNWMLIKDKNKRPSAKELLELPIFNNNFFLKNNINENEDTINSNNESSNYSENENHQNNNKNLNKPHIKNDDNLMIKSYKDLEIELLKLKKENNNLKYDNNNLKGDLEMIKQEQNVISDKFKDDNQRLLLDNLTIENKIKNNEDYISNYKEKINNLNVSIENLYKEVNYKKNLNNHTLYLNYSNNDYIETNENLLEEVLLYFRILEKKKDEIKSFLGKFNIRDDFDLNTDDKDELIQFFMTVVNLIQSEIEVLEINYEIKNLNK